MSWEAQAWARDMGKRFELDPSHRWMLTALANYADKDGNNIYPSIATLVMDTGFGETSVRRHIKHLAAIGLMEYGNQEAALKFRAGNRPKVYRLTMSQKTSPPHAEESRSEAPQLEGSPIERSQIGGSQTGGSQKSPLGGPKRGATVGVKTRNPKENLCAVCERSRPASVIDPSGTCADCLGFGPDAAVAGASFLAQRQLARQARRFGALP